MSILHRTPRSSDITRAMSARNVIQTNRFGVLLTNLRSLREGQSLILSYEARSIHGIASDTVKVLKVFTDENRIDVKHGFNSRACVSFSEVFRIIG